MRGGGGGADGSQGARRRRRAAPAVAASLLAHVGALAWLALTLPRPATPPAAAQPEFKVRLSRPPASAGAEGAPRSRRVARSTALTATTEARRTTAPAQPAPSTAIAPPPVAKPSPTPPSLSKAPAPGAQGPPAAAEGGGAGLTAGDLRGLLRGALGCDHAQLMDLSPAERARCAERLGLASRTAPRIDPIPAEKRAYYDAVADAYAKARAPPGNAPRMFGAAPGRTALDDRGGLMIPMPVCAMKFGIPRGYKSYHDVPPHALKLGKLGPIPCFIPPPQGRWTEESGVEAPASLRERTDDAAHMKALDPPK